jgi:hypothetical protein
MENTFAIVWVAKNFEGAGVGTKRFTAEEANDLASSLNESHQAFLHQAVDVSIEDPLAALAALKQLLRTANEVSGPSTRPAIVPMRVEMEPAEAGLAVA